MYLLHHGYLPDFHWPELSSTEGPFKYYKYSIDMCFHEP